ncbi:hypothetical protein BDB01DRAFT_854176 [Pilobolus umbonatus]|nr:hypothetical protein BDB01DRAFT_854176 [Pilobolus umbonatus]
MLCNENDAPAAVKPPQFLQLHDICVEQEYENLIRDWKNQLIDKTPSTLNTDYVRYAWVRFMDHYLDQHWLDSKQMLQCAQAWSARDSLSLQEAVHTMNILSLKSMQRSLDARQELLHVLGDPDLMARFGINNTAESAQDTDYSSHSTPRFSLSHSEEEQEVHAPILIRHHSDMVEKDTDRLVNLDRVIEAQKDLADYISIDENSPLPQDIYEYSSKKVEVETGLELKTEGSEKILIPALGEENLGNQFEYYCQVSKRPSIWNDKYTKGEDGLIEDRLSTLDLGVNSPLGSGIPWKSWFLNSRSDISALSLGDGLDLTGSIIVSDDDQRPVNSYSSKEELNPGGSFIDLCSQSPIYPRSRFDSFDSSTPVKKSLPQHMVRSESSISTFRPISNNLAPRCQHQVSNHYPSLSSEQSTKYRDSSESTQPLSTINATITKSRSFPNKSSLSTKKRSPTPVKERHFNIRSIVYKKVSLSKLFGGKKPSASTTASITS